MRIVREEIGSGWKMILGDALEILPSLQSNSINAIVTDLPYGNNTAYISYNDTPSNLAKLIELFMPEARRIARVIAITTGIKNMFLYPPPTWVLAWVVPAGIGCSPWGFCCWHPILVYGPDPYLATASGSLPDAVVWSEPSPKLIHPCPKPEKWSQWLINRVTLRGQSVLDCFAGSGTFGVACLRLGRQYTGIEIEERYFDEAVSRLRQEETRVQLPLGL